MQIRPRREEETLHWPIIDGDKPASMSAPARPDWLTRAISVSAVFAWVMIVAVLLIIAYAKPLGENFFSRTIGGRVETRWAQSMLTLAGYLLHGELALCIAGLALSGRREGKRIEGARRNFVILGIVSLVGSILSWFLLF